MRRPPISPTQAHLHHFAGRRLCYRASRQRNPPLGIYQNRRVWIVRCNCIRRHPRPGNGSCMSRILHHRASTTDPNHIADAAGACMGFRGHLVGRTSARRNFCYGRTARRPPQAFSSSGPTLYSWTYGGSRSTRLDIRSPGLSAGHPRSNHTLEGLVRSPARRRSNPVLSRCMDAQRELPLRHPWRCSRGRVDLPAAGSVTALL
jgi:hypothetical protein